MRKVFLTVVLLCLLSEVIIAQTIIPANDSNIQYYGRWVMSNPAGPTHSWPGVYIYAVFQGTSIAIRMDDNFTYYNVFIDSIFVQVFHGTSSGVTTYVLRSGLSDRTHSILLTVRGENSWTHFGFYGFVLDSGKTLVSPPPKPTGRIEFIGDSYTCASGNEWIDNTAPPNDSYSNIYLGFGPVIARHYNSQYQMTSRGGIGLVLDYQGDYSNNLPAYFDRTLFHLSEPKWNFSQWIPNVVVICLGLNDYSGWNGYSAPISDDHALLYRTKYHDFIATVMGEYPGANIVAVAANDIPWLKTNISQVVTEENAMGHSNVHYAYFPYYNGGYVNVGHPSVATHQKIADTLIYAFNTMNIWQPYHGTVKPKITQCPSSPFVVYDTTYTLNVVSDSYATMRYSTQDEPYAQMVNTFTTTGKRNHSVTFSCQHGLQYTYYICGIDIYGNSMDSSKAVSFAVDTTKSIVSWSSTAYDHSQWKTGRAPLGNSSDTSVTTHTDSVKTVYYWKTFSISGNLLNQTALTMSGHDGLIVYVNGREFKRVNMPSGSAAYDMLALQASQFNQTQYFTRISGLQLLQEGANGLAIEVHTATSSSLSTAFDANLIDGSGNTLIASRALWSYYDGGNSPADQIVNRLVNGITGNTHLIPEKTILYTNYPNPFNPSTTIQFAISVKSRVDLSIYDILGREVVKLVNAELPPGTYTRQWNAEKFSGGIYFYRLRTGSFIDAKKLLLIK